MLFQESNALDERESLRKTQNGLFWCLNFLRAPAEPMARPVLLGHFQVPPQSTSSLFNVLLACFLPIYLHLSATGSPGEKTAHGAHGDRDVVLGGRAGSDLERGDK